MSEIIQRDYYKIFTGTNQEGGYDKIHLGYDSNTSEIILKAGETTFFHIPFYAELITIQDSTLIEDGATPGPIPALADRVYKKQAGYSNVTPWGSTSDPRDGTWLCSWLYALSSEPPIWLDRYYNPGRLAYAEALEGRASFEDYYNHDPIYYDVPSALTFEGTCYYQYHHQGQNDIKTAIKTFAGEKQDRLKLDIDDWSPVNSNPEDKSIYKNKVKIDNFKNDWIVNLIDPGYQDRNSLSFNHTDFVNCRVLYNSSYNVKDEFTLSFWVNHDNWKEATSTQLMGNLSRGGYGVFYNNLHRNPFFVVPENTYGHIFYVNQEGVVYLDENVQFTLGVPTNPVSICINSSSMEVIVLDGTNRRLVKYNHSGDVLATNKTNLGNNFLIDGELKRAILDGDDNCTVVSTSGTFVFDKNLILLSEDRESVFQNDEQLAYDIDGNLVRESNCFDLKFDHLNQKWLIKNNGNVYCNNVLLSSLPSNSSLSGINTNLAVDPENKIWVLAGSDKIYKIDPKTKNVIDTYQVGISTGSSDKKNIGFVKNYNRKTNKHTWYAIIYHNFEKMLYYVTLDGNIYKTINLPEKLNIYEPATASQNTNLLTFTGSGDFTGYEQKRIFNKVKFDNNPQLEFKVFTEFTNNSLPNSSYTLSIPTQYFINKTWYLVTAIFKNRTMSLYVNNYLRDEIDIPDNVDLNFDYKSDLYLGCPNGKVDNLNKEINSQSVIWNGYLDSIKIYDYAMDPDFILYLVREKLKPLDIIWNIPSASMPYIEVIDRFFKHKLPGAKSQFFNLRITGSHITDPNTRTLIENDIRESIEKIKPLYTDLLRIEWID